MSLVNPIEAFSQGLNAGQTLIANWQAQKDRQKAQAEQKQQQAWNDELRTRQRQEWAQQDSDRAQAQTRIDTLNNATQDLLKHFGGAFENNTTDELAQQRQIAYARYLAAGGDTGLGDALGLTKQADGGDMVGLLRSLAEAK